MKLIMPMLFATVFLLCGCSSGADVANVEIDYGQSAIYSKQDMDLAIDEIIQEFRTWDGCKLYSISYILYK